jgi:hypothetical protein
VEEIACFRCKPFGKRETTGRRYEGTAEWYDGDEQRDRQGRFKARCQQWIEYAYDSESRHEPIGDVEKNTGTAAWLRFARR